VKRYREQERLQNMQVRSCKQV